MRIVTDQKKDVAAAHACVFENHSECHRATSQIVLLSVILLIVYAGTNLLLMASSKKFYPLIFPGVEMKYMKHAMALNFRYFVWPSFALPTVTALWYMAPLYRAFNRWGQEQDTTLARRRLLNAPVMLSAISFGGWIIANSGLVFGAYDAGAFSRPPLFVKIVLIGLAMQGLSVITSFYFMEFMSRKFLIPLLFSGGNLRDCDGTIVLPIKVRFLLYYFTVCMYPTLLLGGLVITIAQMSNQHGLVRMTQALIPTILLTGGFLTLLISSSYQIPLVAMKRIAGMIRNGDYKVAAPVYSNDEMGNLGEALNEMAAALEERDFVKDTFSLYVTKQIADEILSNPGAVSLGGKRQEVTVLFSDLRSFSAFSESHEPEAVITRLNEYFSAMVDVIFKYGGTLDKYIGDAIMAVFGSPLPHDDDPIRAVNTALEMRERLAELNAKWASEGKTQMEMGIGINTGDAIVGNMGDVRRMEYTVVGDNVNLAARVESLTKDYVSDIIISEGTYEKVKDRIDARRLDSVTVKGRTAAVEIYELRGMKKIEA